MRARTRDSRAELCGRVPSNVTMENAHRISLTLLLAGLTVACGGSAKQAPPPPPPTVARPAPPSGPTRTDFKTIAKLLMKRCVAGGWINEWRSEQPDIDTPRPKIHVRDFEDKTGQDLDPEYLNTVLEQRMRLSGVYDLVSNDDDADFIGRGVLMRLAERRGDDRVSVYTAILNLVEPGSEDVKYSCEATVRGEM